MLRLTIRYEATMKRPALGHEIRRLRRRAGMSQEYLAELLDISRETVGQIERGVIRRPRTHIMNGLAHHLQVSVTTLYQLIIADEDASTSSGFQTTNFMDHICAIANLPTAQERCSAMRHLANQDMKTLQGFFHLALDDHLDQILHSS